MLNQSRVLDYVKDHLGFPFMFVELEDDQILEFITTYTLKEFSYYIPDVRRTNLNLLNPNVQVPGRSNEFYIEEPEGLEILNVTEIYFSLGHQILHGHPPMGPLSHGELREWSLNVAMSQDVLLHSSYDKTYEFRHPNIIRISPLTPQHDQNCAVEYERVHPTDFRTIPNDLQMDFMSLCLADTMIRLGRIRSKYSDGKMSTPFGEIPISAEIMSEGKELKDKMLEKFKERFLPNVTFDMG